MHVQSRADPLPMGNGRDLIEMICKGYESPDDDAESDEHYNYSETAHVHGNPAGKRLDIKSGGLQVACPLLRWLQGGRPAQGLGLRERSNHTVAACPALRQRLPQSASLTSGGHS